VIISIARFAKLARYEFFAKNLHMYAAFHQLGLYVSGHPRRFLAAWVIAIAFGAWGAHYFPSAARGGYTGLAGSASQAVSDSLNADFDAPFLDPVIVAVSTPGKALDTPALLEWTRALAKRLGQMPEVRQVADFAATQQPSLRSADGHESMILVALRATDAREQQAAVPELRAVLTPFRVRLLELDPAASLALTGNAAVNYDVNNSSAEGGDRAEKRALPLTLIILLVAFGTVAAAALPFLMGLATTTVSLGLAFLLAHLLPVSNLLGNVVTMIGLAVGIDYSLLMVKDFRERLKAAPLHTAVAETVAEAGTTICWSGTTVAIGLLGLLWSPLLETRSVGIGGALVVLVSVSAALTLLPACLTLIGPWIERLAIVRWKPKSPGARESGWHRIARWTVAHPAISLILSGGLVLLLALPITGAHSGASNEPWSLPKGMDSRVGAEILSHIQNKNAALDVRILLRATDGEPLLAPAHRRALLAYLDRLHADPRVGRIVAPFAAEENGAVAGLAAQGYVSRDGRVALVEVTPVDSLTVRAAQTLARDVAKIAPEPPITAIVGGSPAYYNDFDAYMWRSFPRVFGFVVLSTLVLLYSAFRSFLLPVKAVIANLMAIAAGYGLVVAIFEFGWLHSLIGLEGSFAAIALEVPLMIFCLSFGLSMDYELFLLFRIRREYLVHGDNARATVEGLAAVAPVITGAGLIMAVVFGAFVGAELPALKMIGVGLCGAVLVDATLIRGFVVPAVMTLAGRWNWYPGNRSLEVANQRQRAGDIAKR
jgi:RND superfamily putative drug exporter